ncbi:MAG: hypothetical protein ACI8ZM_005501 [Crocinitomix sp.]|jgi:hypothetical protein
MKTKMIKAIFIGLFALGMASCNNAESESKTGPEYTSTYVCPMHCEGSGSAEAGQCPVCGMDYVLNKENK